MKSDKNKTTNYLILDLYIEETDSCLGFGLYVL